MGEPSRSPAETRMHAGSAELEIVLLREVGIIVSLPVYSIEERFDLAFLHVVCLPLEASRPTDASIAAVFAQGMDAYRISMINYLTAFCFTNMVGGGRSVWSSFAAESVGALDSRRLFSDPDYRRRITDDYEVMLRSRP